MAKHVAVAYALWLVGFWMGLHHLYLRRTRAAFLHTVSLNMCGLGCWRDLLLMPTFVAEANNKHHTRVRAGPPLAMSLRPRIAWLVVFQQLVLAVFIGWITSSLLPSNSPAAAVELLFATGAAWAIWFGGTALDLSVDAPFARVCIAVVGVELLALAATHGNANNPVFEDVRIVAVLLGVAVFWGSRTWSAAYRVPIGTVIDVSNSNREVHSHWLWTLVLYGALLGAFTVAVATAAVLHGEVTITIHGARRTVAIADAVDNILHSEEPFVHFSDLLHDLHWAASTSAGTSASAGAGASTGAGASAGADTDNNYGGWHAFERFSDNSGRARYLRVLGLRIEDAPSLAIIKRAYRQLALQWHPDKFVTADSHAKAYAKTQFVAVQTAYEKLDALQRDEL